MKSYNEADKIRRHILIKIIELFLDGKLLEDVDRLPYSMRPKINAASRCCIYKDRAILKYRIMAALGAAIEDETDESKMLKEYAKDSLENKYCATTILSLLDIACDSCIQSRYLITNACRGCLARPCTLCCPKKAIKVENGHAIIDHSACVNCGKCMTVCPFHAITRVPIPCEEACPVAAISRSDSGKQQIDMEACITCGKCAAVCPFGAVIERSQILQILQEIKNGQPVIAMLAPAIAGQFPGTLEQLAEALHLLGFKAITEVANGAEMTMRHETSEFIEKMTANELLMTTSCCPAYVELVKKHLPEIAPFVSSTHSPMRFSASSIKKKIPDAITVFIGPCIAKRHEAQQDQNIDYVMTFEELGAWFIAQNIEITELKGIPLVDETNSFTRGFASSNGVTSAIKHLLGQHDCNIDFKPAMIDGLNKKNIKKLSLHAKGKLKENFIEVMACEGGCTAGPRII